MTPRGADARGVGISTEGRAALPGRPLRWLPYAARRRLALLHHRPERGQISLLLLGMTVIAMMLIVGGMAVTSAQLSRIRLLDVADGAALDAADTLDVRAYHDGLGDAVTLSDGAVRAAATAYLASRPLPPGMLSWRVDPSTGSPDGETAVVRVTGIADLPVVGRALSALGGSVTITVTSRARADLVR